MNLTLRDATAFMANLSPVAPPLALSPRRRRNDVKGKALGLRRFKVYLIEGRQPTDADGQILGAQDGGSTGIAISTGFGK
jgi:hypothetical protein